MSKIKDFEEAIAKLGFGETLKCTLDARTEKVAGKIEEIEPKKEVHYTAPAIESLIQHAKEGEEYLVVSGRRLEIAPKEKGLKEKGSKVNDLGDNASAQTANADGGDSPSGGPKN
jgi:23S rRNA maturation-related 3'-5' exoribonuclease YhaM